MQNDNAAQDTSASPSIEIRSAPPPPPLGPSQIERTLTSDLSLTTSHVQFQNSWTALAERSNRESGCKTCSFFIVLAKFLPSKLLPRFTNHGALAVHKTLLLIWIFEMQTAFEWTFPSVQSCLRLRNNSGVIESPKWQNNSKPYKNTPEMSHFIE